MPKVTIDGHEIEVDAGTSILNAARKIGGALVPPTMCYYSKLKGSGGKCRTCLVKVVAQSAANPRPMPKLQASCSTPVADGMVVQNLTSPEVLDARKGIVEFLLLNHPLDCPICDQAGECDLQDLAYAHGLSTSRNDFPRRTFETIDLGER
ncbi:MAG: 2Fe-2S iron-sulfur cluster-binding protein, partial [Spirochaetota bacterium]